MCTSPIWIKNKGYRIDDPLSPYMVQVPCGHCEQCKQARISEMLFRCDWHNRYVKAHNGFSVFSTLTFNDEHLNILTYRGTDGHTYKCSTWNSKLLHKFLKSMKKYFAEQNCELTYIVSCERGSNGTKRPHYHVIFWIVPRETSLPSYTDVTKQIALCWSTFDARTIRQSKDKRGKQQSIVDLSAREKLPPFSFLRARVAPIGNVYNELVGRTDNEAIKYVVKYVFKDAGEQVLRVKPEQCISTTFNPLYLKDMLPRVYQSNDIGSYWYDFITKGCLTSYEIGRLMAKYVGKTSDGQTSAIPRYYVQKYGQDVNVLSSQIIRDDAETWHSLCGVVPKHYNDIPRTFGTGDDTTITRAYRDQLTTQRLPNDIGRAFAEQIHKDKCHDTYISLQAYKTQDFQFPEVSSLPALGNEFFEFLQYHFTDYEFKRARIIEYLCPLTEEQFTQLFMFVYHHTPSDDKYLQRFPDSSQINSWLAIQDFLAYRSAYNLENRARTARANQQAYERNLYAVIQRKPEVFASRKLKDLTQ